MQNTKGLIPYDDKGNMQDKSYSYHSTNTEWRTNDPFVATLRLVHVVPGRSAVTFWFEDFERHRYPVNLTQVVPILLHHLERGQVHGEWIASQRGDSYTLKLLRIMPQTTGVPDLPAADPTLIPPADED